MRREEAEEKATRATVEGRHGNIRLREIYVDVDVPNTDNPDEVGWKVGSKIVFTADKFYFGDEPWPHTIPRTNHPADLVIIETPYSGDVEANTAYARAETWMAWMAVLIVIGSILAEWFGVPTEFTILAALIGMVIWAPFYWRSILWTGSTRPPISLMLV
ncbi:hypothetical protein [Ochrobactrum sp. BTU1]|uniref:hypothetical protein n=1 Tax=Ochrobactrum sp. BTU1 TaxID=2840456 RepID=UPI001C05329A|nr:hypothetical protein KMS41_15100 [Ochrobactrum sp. BTU1]